MKAGFARVEMTPTLGTLMCGYFHDRPADGFITPLYVNTIVLDDGEKKAALITLDLEGMNRVDNTILREKIEERTGINAEAIFIHCVHTHLGPYNGDYSKPEECCPYDFFFISRVLDCVTFALQDMEKSGEAKMYVAKGKAEGISFVRLFRLKDGSFKTHAKIEDPMVEGPVGYPDEEVQLVKITREGDSDIAIAHFGTHPDVVGKLSICYDWPGFVRDILEKSLDDSANGKGVHAICFNGAQGDVNHVDHYHRRRGGLEHAKHMARVIAGEIMGIYTYAEEVDCSKIDYKQSPINVKTAKGTPEQVEMAKKIRALGKIAQEKGVSNAVYLAKKAGVVDFDEGVAFRYTLLENWPEYMDLFVSVLAIGDIAFVGFPGEPFTQIGVQTKAGSPYKMTLPCCYGNGGEGYFPMLEVFTNGGYEATTSRFVPGTAEKLIEHAIKMTNEMYNNR